jgi:3-methylcrotonyl-CoA carboxylase alpha subunit
MFGKILIANRGEIACRVIATARRLGIATVAVYSDADPTARHVALADEAWPIGPAPARQSYLVSERVLDAAKRSGAQAIHPGYGFLSENADFAEACAQAGIVFIGPPAAAIRAMGSKAAAKALMESSGVPLVPGYHGADQSPAILTEAAAQIGYPVLIKASAGGGGKGMRIVERPQDFPAMLEGARREARASFGDDRVLIEKYLTRPRHIEIQVFGDTHDNMVYLFERDCSIQRRHQKVLEEAPAPGMDPQRRRAMGQAACAAARAVGYVGAGTVEFIAEDHDFYFMEMNTRLQVEHPVTEMITGHDLVEWQLRVACGEPLPCTQDCLRIDGHAIEARIYAEDPSRDFLPSIGMLAHLRQPASNAHVRVDTGVRQGDTITPFYDPMIAKLIVHGADRAAAVRRLSAALRDYEIVGVQTNLALLRGIAADSDFAGGLLDTGFIGRHGDLLRAPPADEATQIRVLSAAALSVLARLHGANMQAAPASDPHSPWNDDDAWRLNGDGFQDIALLHANKETALRVYPGAHGCRIEFPQAAVHAVLADGEDAARLALDGIVQPIRVVPQGDTLIVIVDGANHVVTYVDRLAAPLVQAAGDDKLTAPIPARVSRILVRPGDTVKKGTPLLVLEAMKMELTLFAPIDGTIASVRHGVDDMVQEGTELVTFVTETGGST